MKKILHIILLLFGYFNSNGQVSIANINLTGLESTPGSFVNGSLINSTSKNYTCQLQISVKAGDEIILELTSGSFTLNPGITNINSSSIKILNKQFGGTELGRVYAQTGILPSGTVQVCYELFSIEDEFTPADLCEEIELISNTVLNLIYPLDDDTIYTINPVLMWFHNMPFKNSRLSYRILLAEIIDNTSRIETIQEQNIIWVGDFISSHSVTIPNGLTPGVQRGKSYLWKIQEMAAGRILNETETWKFIVGDPQPEQPVRYVELSKYGVLKPYKAIGGKVYFKFNDRYASQGKLNYRLYDSEHKLVQSEIKVEAANGNSSLVLKGDNDNQYILDLDAKKIKDGIYQLEVEDEAGNIYKLVIELGI